MRSPTGGGCAQSDGYAFADYARFLTANPGWPGESDAAPRRREGDAAGRSAARPSSPSSAPTSRPAAMAGPGWPRPIARPAARPRRSPRRARRGTRPTSAAMTRAILLGRFGRSFTAADHDRRIDALLFDKKASEAPARCCRGRAGPPPGACRADRDADPRARRRGALRRRVAAPVASDAGLLIDRARYLARYGNESAARASLPRGRTISSTARPIPSASTRCSLILARGALADAAIHDRLQHRPPGRRRLRRRAPTSALKQLWRARRIYHADLARRDQRAAASAARPTRSRCSTAMPAAGARCRSRPRAIIGPGAPRRRPAGWPTRRSYFERAAAYPELFYGQLALERLGRAVPRRRRMPSATRRPPPQRTAFQQQAAGPRDAAARPAGPLRRAGLFVRALPKRSTTTPTASSPPSCGRRSGGQDLAVWMARSARNSGSAFYIRAGLPDAFRRACRAGASGRWPTASPARKARSTAPRSATPARAG